ncbi:hypothetical protein BJV78DRAFT_1209781, partial [Lactifluus subvellereus]
TTSGRGGKWASRSIVGVLFVKKICIFRKDVELYMKCRHLRQTWESLHHLIWRFQFSSSSRR